MPLLLLNPVLLFIFSSTRSRESEENDRYLPNNRRETKAVAVLTHSCASRFHPAIKSGFYMCLYQTMMVRYSYCSSWLSNSRLAGLLKYRVQEIKHEAISAALPASVPRSWRTSVSRGGDLLSGWLCIPWAGCDEAGPIGRVFNRIDFLGLSASALYLDFSS